MKSKMDETFWKEVKGQWITKPESQPQEEIPFDGIDFEEAVQAVLQGIVLTAGVPEKIEMEEKEPEQTEPEETAPEEPERRTAPMLDQERFDRLMEKRTLMDYAEASKVLRACELPEKMDRVYYELEQKMAMLQEAIKKFEGIYEPDMEMFYEYYIPETLQLAATYLEYLNMGVKRQIAEETEKEVMESGQKLLMAVGDKIEEICKYASMEIKAKAKALESMMSQDGYVDLDFRIK